MRVIPQQKINSPGIYCTRAYSDFSGSSQDVSLFEQRLLDTELFFLEVLSTMDAHPYLAIQKQEALAVAS